MLTSDTLGMVADTATTLIERLASGYCEVLKVCTAFILLTTTSNVAPRVASFTTCTWYKNIFHVWKRLRDICMHVKYKINLYVLLLT